MKIYDKTLIICAKEGMNNLLKYLILKGADVYLNNHEPVKISIQYKQYETTKILLQHYSKEMLLEIKKIIKNL